MTFTYRHRHRQKSPSLPHVFNSYSLFPFLALILFATISSSNAQSICYAIDESTSLSQSGFRLLTSSLLTLTRSISEQISLKIKFSAVDYSTKARIIQRPTSKLKKFLQSLRNNAQFGGYTASGIGLKACSKLLRKTSQRPKILFLFTDGNDNKDPKAVDAAPKLKENYPDLNIGVIAIGIENEQDRTNLKNIVATKQDLFFDVPSFGVLDEFINEMVTSIDKRMPKIRPSTSETPTPSFLSVTPTTTISSNSSSSPSYSTSPSPTTSSSNSATASITPTVSVLASVAPSASLSSIPSVTPSLTASKTASPSISTSIPVLTSLSSSPSPIASTTPTSSPTSTTSSTSTTSPSPSKSSPILVSPSPLSIPDLSIPPPPFVPDAPASSNLEILRINTEFFVGEQFTLVQPKKNPTPPKLRVTSQIVDSSTPNFPFDQFPRYQWTTNRIMMNNMIFRQNLSNCAIGKCAARIVIISDRFLRWIVIRKALRKIRQRPNFSNVFATNKATFKIVRQGKQQFAVYIPFKKLAVVFG